jgi:molecular chaperone DnaK
MSDAESPIIGIDLGTTNSVLAAYINGKIQVIPVDGRDTMPSIVGFGVDGKLLVGQAAKNQLAAFPDKTIASVKRRMGEAVQLRLGDKEFSPQEISATILRKLRLQAQQVLGTEVTRAVITVPAFFSEEQRQATREAGQIAGFTVERIINEPTAASLVYHADDKTRKHLIVYDLGGGTFDVSIVRIEDGVVEVLSSKGDTQLGGDDFDELLTGHVAKSFLNEHGVDLMEQPTTRWRLLQACERAKCELSFAASIRVTEEFITTVNGQPINLDVAIDRHEYEELIAQDIERTIQCVDEAIRDSGLKISQIDELILVGGSTRTPLVQRRLKEEFQRDPKWSVNPDLAVALGAATQAAMQLGHSIGPILIDVATHTLGIKALGEHNGMPKLKYAPILHRNTPLPARYEETFVTVSERQDKVEIEVMQGESDQLSQNRMIGTFIVDGVNQSQNSDGIILVRFELTLDGILQVTAIERATGKSETLKIDNALTRMGQASSDSSQRWQDVFGAAADSDIEVANDSDIEVTNDLDDSSFDRSQFVNANENDEGHTHESIVNAESIHRIDAPVKQSLMSPKLSGLMKKAESMVASLNTADSSDVQRIINDISVADDSDNQARLNELEAELDDLLFYLSN